MIDTIFILLVQFVYIRFFDMGNCANAEGTSQPGVDKDKNSTKNNRNTRSDSVVVTYPSIEDVLRRSRFDAFKENQNPTRPAGNR